MFWTGVGIVVALILIFAIIDRRAVGRIFGAGQAQVDKFGRAISDADPLALYQKKIDDEMENMQKYKDSLATVGENVRSLKRQIDGDTARETQLAERIRLAKTQNNDNAARDYALQLDHVEQTLETNKTQLASTQKIYDGFLKQINAGQNNILACRQKAKDMGIQLQQSEAEKKMSQFTAELAGMSTHLDGLSDIEAKVQAKIDHNRAAVDVVAQTSGAAMQEIDMQEAERNARADAILARFDNKVETPAAS